MTKKDELRIITNFLKCVKKVYRKQNQNWCVVRDILMNGTSTAGRTSCISKCYDLGIDPYGYKLEFLEERKQCQ